VVFLNLKELALDYENMVTPAAEANLKENTKKPDSSQQVNKELSLTEQLMNSLFPGLDKASAQIQSDAMPVRPGVQLGDLGGLPETIKASLSSPGNQAFSDLMRGTSPGKNAGVQLGDLTKVPGMLEEIISSIASSLRGSSQSALEEFNRDLKPVNKR